MNKKTKVIAVSVITTILLVAIGTIIGIIIWDNKDSEKKDSYSLQIDRINENTNIDVMVYGEEPGFREDFEWRRIHSVSEQSLKKDKFYSYRCIVLFDYNGTMEISDEELLLIKEQVENEHLDMFYIGKNYLDDLVRLGFASDFNEAELSFAYIGSIYKDEEVKQNYKGNLHAVHGIWTEADEKVLEFNSELIQEVLVNFIYEYEIKSEKIVY